MSDAPPLAWKIINWIGIVSQLINARGEKLLKPLELNVTDFAVLTHMIARESEARTVTAIAAAMQMNQPNVTKIVAKLMKRKAVRATPNGADGRSKLLALTPEGRALHQRALQIFAPAFAQLFASWTLDEQRALFQGLDRLKIFLDANR